jgi:hypothetical protein
LALGTYQDAVAKVFEREVVEPLAQRMDVQSRNLDMSRSAALIETTVAYNFIGMQFTETEDRFHECWSDTSEVVTPNPRQGSSCRRDHRATYHLR